MTEAEAIDLAKKRLGRRPIVLVGLMGCGKTSVGKRLAFKLNLPFVRCRRRDRARRRQDDQRNFRRPRRGAFPRRRTQGDLPDLGNGPQILATGGGAFINAETRQRIKDIAVSVWLRADLPVLMRRVMKRDTPAPLLRDGNPEATMQKLIETRYPIYAEADMTVESRDGPTTSSSTRS